MIDLRSWNMYCVYWVIQIITWIVCLIFLGWRISVIIILSNTVGSMDLFLKWRCTYEKAQFTKKIEREK